MFCLPLRMRILWICVLQCLAAHSIGIHMDFELCSALIWSRSSKLLAENGSYLRNDTKPKKEPSIIEYGSKWVLSSSEAWTGNVCIQIQRIHQSMNCITSISNRKLCDKLSTITIVRLMHPTELIWCDLERALNFFGWKLFVVVVAHCKRWNWLANELPSSI